MVATRRSSQRLQEKATSAPSSPVADVTTPTRGAARKTGSATKKSPATGSAAKGKTSPKRSAKNAAVEEGEGDGIESAGGGAIATEESKDEVATELFHAETKDSQGTAEDVSEQDASEETPQTSAAPVLEGDDAADSQATEDEEEVLLMMDSDDENDGDAVGEDEEEEDISAYVMMAASGINLSTTKPATSNAAASSSSSQTSAARMNNLVPDALDSGASQHATYFEFQGYKSGAKLVADKRTQEEQATLKSQLQVAAQSHRQREEHQNKKSAGRKWFDMESQELTADARRDFALLRMRNYLDPKKFYKTSDHHKKLPKHFQMGVVIEGAHEFKSARLTKKERHQTFTEEIMADATIQSYTKRVFGQIQAARSGQGKKKKMQKRY